MTERLVNFGYTEIHLTADCLLGNEGTKVRGHSFHCSELQDPLQIDRVYRTRNFLSGREEIEGFRRKNILASYVHLHFGSNPNVATSFVRHVCTIRGKDPIAPQETMR
jgi:cobyrinic acid a,c-diamide synthase